MVIWLNGTFGAGKTSTAKELVPLVPDARYFDPEQVGYMLTTVSNLPRLGNFQHWKPWRHLVVETAAQLLDYVGGVLVMPQTVLFEEYWREIRDGLESAGIPVRLFVLHTDQDTLVRRIEPDAEAVGNWRLEHLAAYQEAFAWLSREGEVVDTTGLLPEEVARHIAGLVIRPSSTGCG
ncbi:AAA domain-containing protein [Nonomuraea solani]|uniref:AAA domain-containing protein n=1 Tax=Nonomuraea solani TaxID=1144553 RepID=A0A1H6CYL7_9ACTN|nr:AAA family ATPase [Nonomuraea solani]SEG78141.1 AAA domain-containing protein [Nonomuraea solani]